MINVTKYLFLDKIPTDFELSIQTLQIILHNNKNNITQSKIILIKIALQIN